MKTRIHTAPAVKGVTLYPLNYFIQLPTDSELCLTTATHNFKWVEITDIY